MFVLHANWHSDQLHLWAESSALFLKSAQANNGKKNVEAVDDSKSEVILNHPFACGEAELRQLAARVGFGVAENAPSSSMQLVL
ncbi:MAG: hypothetical protein EBT78_18850, partial [Betaproteobacteria bacterium]|nr:hypothetical protein [Betaproteobacteria bacterium]